MSEHLHVAAEASELYRSMLRIRMVEETVAHRYSQQEMRCPVHLSIGQEGAAVAVCAALNREDVIFSTHRSHAHYLAKGGDLTAMIAELHGKVTGCCGGRGGSMHLYDHEVGVMSSVPIVGSNIPLAVGAALSFKQRGEKHCAVAFLGDGAAEEGVFHESLNFAATHNLPVLFVLENNLYSVYTPLHQRQPSAPLTRFADAHRIPSFQADASEVEDCHAKCLRALHAIDRGEGPQLLVVDTYRYHAHCGPEVDDELGYRPEDEQAYWRNRCPVRKLEEKLQASGDLSPAKEELWRVQFQAEIDAAFEACSFASFPAPETVKDFIYPGTPSNPSPAEVARG